MLSEDTKGCVFTPGGSRGEPRIIFVAMPYKTAEMKKWEDTYKAVWTLEGLTETGGWPQPTTAQRGNAPTQPSLLETEVFRNRTKFAV